MRNRKLCYESVMLRIGSSNQIAQMISYGLELGHYFFNYE